MKKAILSILTFCFAVFSLTAQVESATAGSQKNAVEQSKVTHEKVVKEKAEQVDQSNSQVENPNAPVITFDKLVHNYGTISQNDDGNCEFTFKNEGKEPLILTNVRSS
ncbi:MAG: DUF1573 domain-containing protein [Bacteroidales bacterium]|nr:DUF1573 domain-containing protein [Bacteroidales bacterium]